MALIEERRKRAGMSQRAAAAIAAAVGHGTFSPTRWRQLEDGGRKMGATWIPEEAPDMTLARMALAVGLTYEEVRPFSERAALMLADLLAERNANERQAEEDAARMVDALGSRRPAGKQREALEAEIASALRKLRDE